MCVLFNDRTGPGSRPGDFYAHRLATRILRAAGEGCDLEVRIGIGGRKEDWRELRDSYQQACTALTSSDDAIATYMERAASIGGLFQCANRICRLIEEQNLDEARAAVAALPAAVVQRLGSGAESLAPGDYVVISVIDNGSGMSEEAKAHLFEPFFTTKTHDRSSGLGLATSYGIVCQSGGRIRVESERGKGTRVRIYLPKVPAPPPPSYRKPSSKLLPTGTESILVVEDDVSVRHISVRVLRNLGYDVIEAASCVDAQRLLEERENREIHLLLTDMVMPQMSGRDFAEWLRKISPQTKVVFVSGYLEESINPRDRIEAGTFFLSKPFDPEQLATAIRQALDS
jgi:CheY-like chemotaxis protein